VKILVTGGAGFIGSNLSNYYLNKGHEVTVFDNLSRKGTEKNLEWLRYNHKKNLSFIKNDIRNFNPLLDATKDADVILHIAAQVAVTTSVKNPMEDFEINALGTFNVLESARQNNTDPIIIFCSTNKVYGNNVNNIPVIEKEKRYEFSDPEFIDGIPEKFSTDANEHTPYGSSKYAADVFMRDFSAVYGMKTVTFRCSCIYGSRQFGNEDQGWVAHFTISSILNRPMIVYGDGKQVRDILFIDDLVRAFDTASERINKTKGQAFNIGGGSKNTISLLELIDLLEKLTGNKIKFTFDGWRPFDQKVYISDIKKAKKTFGWEPKITKEEGIKKLFNWVNSEKKTFTY
jgi:CDP-paratose 2-epimerase